MSMAPAITLSRTLADLYSLDGGDSKQIALLYAIPHPTQLAKSIPTSVRYGRYFSHTEAAILPLSMCLHPHRMNRFCNSMVMPVSDV